LKTDFEIQYFFNTAWEPCHYHLCHVGVY